MRKTFRHEALLYDGEREFLAGTTSFIRQGLAAGEPALVVVSGPKIDLMREALGGDAGGVRFADMAEVGANPARIIPAWYDFLIEQAAGGRPCRGIGEPIWRERSPAELVECQRHESLINVAFAGGPSWRLLCPYDVGALDPSVIEEARRSHPLLMSGAGETGSASYRGIEASGAAFVTPLPDPSGAPAVARFDGSSLEAVRTFVSRAAADTGLGRARTTDLVQAVNEVATNSIRHGGGGGTLRVWREAETLVCEIADEGPQDGLARQPLAGRTRPGSEEAGGRGLWLANQLCDLVQVRTFPAGTVVRLHARI